MIMPDWLVAVGAFFLILGWIQTVIWVNNIYIGPFLQRRLPRSKDFQKLIDSGSFAVPLVNIHHEIDGPTSAIALVGKIDGYAVEISSNYLTGWWIFPFYIVRVFFNADELPRNELLVRREDNLENSKFFRWSENISLTSTHVDEKHLGSGFGPPSSQVVLDTAKGLIAELKALELKPVDYAGGIEQWRINQD